MELGVFTQYGEEGWIQEPVNAVNVIKTEKLSCGSLKRVIGRKSKKAADGAPDVLKVIR